MAPENQSKRKSQRPRHSATHITVWNLNGSPVQQSTLQRIEAAVEAELEDERMLMQVVRV